MTKNGKRFNQQFKEDIFRLIHGGKEPVSSIVKDFGVRRNSL